MIESLEDKLSAIEDAIFEQLSPLIADGLDVIGAPERRGPAKKAECLFFLTSIKPQPTGAGGIKPNTQISTLEYTANLLVKDLRSHRVLYPFVQAIAHLLQGFKPDIEGCTPIRFEGCRYVVLEQKEGLRWHYELTFSLSTILPRP